MLWSIDLCSRVLAGAGALVVVAGTFAIDLTAQTPPSTRQTDAGRLPLPKASARAQTRKHDG